MYCVFCEIIARRSPATIRYEDDEVIVIDNKMQWTPVMLLVMPKKHVGQEEMWRDETLRHIAKIAVQMGQKFCPNGYRLLSNVGPDALQSQEHGHLHVIGGTYLGPYA